jgi:hypothetical protein
MERQKHELNRYDWNIVQILTGANYEVPCLFRQLYLDRNLLFGDRGSAQVILALELIPEVADLDLDTIQIINITHAPYTYPSPYPYAGEWTLTFKTNSGFAFSWTINDRIDLASTELRHIISKHPIYIITSLLVVPKVEQLGELGFNETLQRKLKGELPVTKN